MLRRSTIAAFRLCAALSLVAAGSAAAESTRVLPVLSQESGRVEALLLLDPTTNGVQARGLDRALQLQPTAAIRTMGLGPLADGKLSASLSLEAQPGLALLCDGDIGLAAALGSLGERCLLAELGADPLMPASARRIGAETLWTSDNGAFDLRFGLSWLDGKTQLGAGRTDAPLAPADTDAIGLSPAFGGLGMAGGFSSFAGALSVTEVDINQLDLGLRGLYRFSGERWLELSGAHSRGVLERLGLPSPLRVSSSALSLSGGMGAFSGRITGRLIELPDGGLPFNLAADGQFDLDLGVSWRTPWRARLTVGTRNLLGKPDVSEWPLGALPRKDGESDTRTPFVRYHQDL